MNAQVSPSNLTSSDLPLMPRRLKSQFLTDAFSLVEVVMALGVIAFALIPLLGLLPMGLSMQRNAIEETTLAQISQVIVGDLQRSEFDTLVADSNGGRVAKEVPIRYFDDQGRYLGDENNSSAVNSRNRIYDVKTELSLTSPGGNGGAISSRNLLRATIKVAANPGKIKAAELFADRAKYQVRFALIAKAK